MEMLAALFSQILPSLAILSSLNIPMFKNVNGAFTLEIFTAFSSDKNAAAAVDIFVGGRFVKLKGITLKQIARWLHLSWLKASAFLIEYFLLGKNVSSYLNLIKYFQLSNPRQSSLTFLINFVLMVIYVNRTMHIIHQCRKRTALSCHRCIICTGVEKMNNI